MHRPRSKAWWMSCSSQIGERDAVGCRKRELMRTYHLPAVTDASIAVSLERSILWALDLASEGDVNPAFLTSTERHSYQTPTERYDLTRRDRGCHFRRSVVLAICLCS
jgi:hypothetical protein